MRPTRNLQSALRTPLNAMLGTEVNVRVLRILAGASEPLSGTQLAREAALTASGVYGALEGLRDTGIVERIGIGARGQFRLNERHPLAGAVKRLFTAERERLEGLFDGLRRTAAGLSPPPRAVWAYGPTVRGDDRPGDPVNVAVVAGSAELSALMDQLRDRVTSLERKYDVTIEVRGFTDADVGALPPSERAELEGAETLLGLPPDVLFEVDAGVRPVAAKRTRGQADHDRRLLDLAAAIARKLPRDPTIATRALERIRRRMPEASAGERIELREWETVLRAASLPRLARLLVDRGPQATRLRQSLPFVDVLTAAERRAIGHAGGE